MKIALLNLEPKYRNFALDKISLFYRQQGAEVVPYDPLWHDTYDKIYCSSIFTFTDKQNVPADAICGGSGFDLTTKLPDEIEAVKPKLNYGFTSRGCIRKCQFCIVPQKEGIIKPIGDLLDLWDGKSKSITLFDNNILALPDHFSLICEQARTNNIRIDFNQGLDFRLVAPNTVSDMIDVKINKYWRFAWDNINDDPLPVFQVLRDAGFQVFCYVLCGFNTIEEQDLYRVEKLRELGVESFAMAYTKKNKRLKKFCRWVNKKWLFKKVKWEDYK